MTDSYGPFPELEPARKYTLEKANLVIRAYGEGLSLKSAFGAIGICARTGREWRNACPDFDAALEQKKSEKITTYLERVDANAQQSEELGVSQRAAEFMLSKLDPEQFGTRVKLEVGPADAAAWTELEQLLDEPNERVTDMLRRLGYTRNKKPLLIEAEGHETTTD